MRQVPYRERRTLLVVSQKSIARDSLPCDALRFALGYRPPTVTLDALGA